MIPDDWQKGMENEAASVEDREWARETRQVVSRQRLWSSIRPVLLTVALAEALLLLVNTITVQQTWSNIQSRPWFTTEPEWWAFSLCLLLVLTVFVGVLLSLGRVAPGLAIPVFLLFPVFQVINGLVVPHPGTPFPGSTLEAVDLYPRLSWEQAMGLYVAPWGWAQFLTITVGIWVGLRLGARLRSRFQRPRSI